VPLPPRRLDRRRAAGVSLTDAAEALGIARNTARTHPRRIFNKTGACRQAQLIRRLLVDATSIELRRER